jgi:hypothetical protein
VHDYNSVENTVENMFLTVHEEDRTGLQYWECKSAREGELFQDYSVGSVTEHEGTISGLQSWERNRA